MNSGFIRQSTNGQGRVLGPFISSADNISPATSLTIVNTDVKLVKNGAVAINKNAGGGTHRSNGDYAFTFDSSDTDTVGELDVTVLVVGALLVTAKFTILAAPVYDAWYMTTTVAGPPAYVFSLASVRPVLGLGIQPTGVISLE